ncbi:hypothetical protein FDECE_9599 [Fusarium decemcellulare]|nr:hypothetical protein FDECE_9599 [Fusarium decemcellulare]
MATYTTRRLTRASSQVAYLIAEMGSPGMASIASAPSRPNARRDMFEINNCVSLNDPRCPNGLIFDVTYNGCVSKDGPEYPYGTTFDGTKCVSSKSPDCPHPRTKYDPKTKECNTGKPPSCAGPCRVEGWSICVDGTLRMPRGN